MDKGIIYIATGAKYCEEAAASARSSRAAMPDIPITLFTDHPEQVKAGVFDGVELIANPTHSLLDKIEPLWRSPYERTLFLDTDTYVLGPVYELFEILDRYEFSYCQAPGRGADNPDYLAICPMAFAEPNTGVMSYRRTERTVKLFRDWRACYEAQVAEQPRRITHDQPAFRKVLYESDVRALVLPPEYNLRTIFPLFKGRMPAKILHGRNPTLGAALKVLGNPRYIDRCVVFNFRDDLTFLGKRKRKLQRFLAKLRTP